MIMEKQYNFRSIRHEKSWLAPQTKFSGLRVFTDGLNFSYFHHCYCVELIETQLAHFVQTQRVKICLRIIASYVRDIGLDDPNA